MKSFALGTRIYFKNRGKDACPKIRATRLYLKIEVKIIARIFGPKTLPQKSMPGLLGPTLYLVSTDLYLIGTDLYLDF